MSGWMMALMIGCRGGSPAPEAAAEQATTKAIEATTQAAAPTGWSEQGLKRHMQKHFSAATDGVWYLAHDRLQPMRVRVSELAHAPHDDIVEPLKPYAVRMSEVAAKWVAAADVDQAAQLSAQLAGSCSACHEAWGAIPPLSEDDLAMADLEPDARHSMAPYLMWVGLVLPSDEAWTTGTANLMAEGDPAIGTEAGESFAKLARWAREATGDERRDVWVDVLRGCTDCHSDNAGTR